MMSEQSNKKKYGLSYADMFICTNCKRLSTLRFADSYGKGLVFPNGDFSVVDTACPRCKTTLSLKNEQLLKTQKSTGQQSSDKSNQTIAILEKDNEDLKVENENLTTENENLKKKLYRTEGRLEEYRRMYGTNDSFTSEVTDGESP